MGAEKREHEIRVIKREFMSVSGVEEVVSFDENGADLISVEGELIVEGENIKIGALDTERGVVTLSGKIDGFYYVNEDKNSKRGFFSRLRK